MPEIASIGKVYALASIPMDPSTGLACGLAGLLIGQQMEIPVRRAAEHARFGRPWYVCESCGAKLAVLAGCPIYGLVRPKSVCPNCLTPNSHPTRARWLALTTAVAGAIIGTHFGTAIALVPMGLTALVMVAVSAVDLERMIIPVRLVYPASILIGASLVGVSVVHHQEHLILASAVSGLAAYLVFLAVHMIVPSGMGRGDVRLAGLAGMVSGWISYGAGYVAFASAFLLAGLAGVIVMLVTGQGRKTKLPFGPFLAAGTLVGVVWGPAISAALLHTGA